MIEKDETSNGSNHWAVCLMSDRLPLAELAKSKIHCQNFKVVLMAYSDTYILNSYICNMLFIFPNKMKVKFCIKISVLLKNVGDIWGCFDKY